MPAGPEPPAPDAAAPPATAAEDRAGPGPRGQLRIHSGELISAISALALGVLMFGLEWYGVVGVPRVRRSGVNTAENAWNGLALVRWPMVLTVLITLGTVVVHASQRAHGARTDTGLPVAVAGTVTALLLAYRVLIDLPSASSVVDVKLGAFLGLLAALGIAVGGLESAREERERRARVQPRSRRGERLAPARAGR